MRNRITQVRKLSDAERFAAHLETTRADIEFDTSVDSGPESALGQPITVQFGFSGPRTIGNRFATLPMEGWDATTDGQRRLFSACLSQWAERSKFRRHDMKHLKVAQSGVKYNH